MFNFISSNQTNDLIAPPKQDNEEEIKSSEAFQGDAAVISKVNELNELREFDEALS